MTLPTRAEMTSALCESTDEVIYARGLYKSCSPFCVLETRWHGCVAVCVQQGVFGCAHVCKTNTVPFLAVWVP